MNRGSEIEKCKKSVQTYKKLDKDIGTYTKALKKLKEKRDNEYNSIFESMQKLNLKKIMIDKESGSTIQTCYKKKREGLNKKFVQKRMKEYCNDHRINYEELNDHIYNIEHRPATEILGLKKTKAKKGKK